MSVVVGAFSHDLVICDVPEISHRLVEKPVATLLAETQAFEVARSRRLRSEPGLYKCVSVRPCVCVCARPFLLYVKVLSRVNRSDILLIRAF